MRTILPALLVISAPSVLAGTVLPGTVLAGAVLAGCDPDPIAAGTTPGDPTDGVDPTDDPSTDDTDTDTTPTTPPATGDTGATTPTDTGVPWSTDVDCSALAPIPVAQVKYGWAPSSEDFTFSDDGYMYSVSAGGLRRTPFGGPSELLVPLSQAVRGTRFLPDGRIALATFDSGSIALVDPVTGAQSILAAGLDNPNGIAIGLDGWVYVATSGRILRADPDTGDVQVVADLPGNSFDGLTFSPDYTRLYFDEELGQIHYVDFDANGNPGVPQLGAAIPTSAFGILDGMAMDACGNLYVIEMSGVIWRVRTDGTVEDIAHLNGLAFVPAMNFGYPSTGGWQNDALYVLDFIGAVYELQVGVPGKWEPHLPPQN
ncbi:MAG: SMP-30/gluconolactonase/LRE family protein [Myxococcota bacterium]